MKKMCFSLSLLLFTWLLSLAVVCAQPGDFKWSRGPNHLYPVSKWDATARVKRIGFINNAGKLVIDYDKLPSSTAMVGEFHEGRAAIYLNRKEVPPGSPSSDIGFIDESGNIVIPPRFHLARDFSEGLAYVIGDEFRGFIDLQGKPVIKTDNNSTRDFHEGLAAVSSENKGWGYVDRSGKPVIQHQYGFADDFSEGLAGVVVGDKFGFINQKGEMVIPPRFIPRQGEYAWSGIVATSRFSEGLAPVTTELVSGLYGVYGYINQKGDFVIPPQFYAAQLFSEGLAFVVEMEPVTKEVKRVGWIDKSGQWVVTEVQRYVTSNTFSKTFVDPVGYLDWRYSEGLVSFRVYPGEKVLHGYMDRKGKVVIEPREFAKIGPFLGGIARVFVKGAEGSSDDYGYINKTGQFIWHSK